MNIDETDIGIFVYFLETKTSHTVVEITKKIFNPKNRHILIKKVSFVSYRVGKWVKQGLLDIEMKDGVKHYRLRDDKVHYGDSSLIIGNDSIETGKAIALQMEKDNYLAVFFLRENDV